MYLNLFLSFFMSMLFISQADAQPDYDRARRQREIDQANQRQSEKQNEYNNRPSDTKWGTATGVFVRSQKVVTEVDIAAREKQRQFLEKQKQEQDLRTAEILKKMADDKLKDGGASGAFKAYYNQMGYFTSEETDRLQLLTKRIEGNINPRADYYLSFGDKYKAYLSIADTAKFDEIMDAIEPFVILPFTTMKALKKLEIKFPEKKFEIDMAYLEVLKNYFNGVNGVGNGYTSDFNNYGTYNIPEYFDWSDLFVELGKKYPEIVAKGMANDEYGATGYFDPYTRTLEKLSSKYRTSYKNSSQAKKKYKEVSDAKKEIVPKYLYWKGLLKNK